MHTFEANRVAVGDEAKAVREALRSLGYARSIRWVYRQTEAPRDVTRLDFYGAFWRWYQALFLANRAGADFLIEDLCSRDRAMRERDSLAAADWYEEIALCEGEHSEALQAAILNRDSSAIKKELAEAIAAYRKLLAMVEARGEPNDGFDGGQGSYSSCDPARSPPTQYREEAA